jgi:cytidylate kinase
VAPLRPDRDAVMLDTTSLTFDQQVEQIVALAATRFPE